MTLQPIQSKGVCLFGYPIKWTAFLFILTFSNFIFANTNPDRIHHSDSSLTSEIPTAPQSGIAEMTTPTDRFWLTLTSPSNIEVMTALVYFQGGKDEYWWDDTDTLGNSDDIFTIVEDHQVVIQGKAPFRDYDQVSLGYRSFQSGTYIIAVHQVEGVFSTDQDIYLTDKLLNKTVNLSKGSYKFQTRATENNDRFSLSYSPKSNFSLSNNDNNQSSELSFVLKNNQLNIVSQSEKITEVELFNLNNRSVYKKAGINSNQHLVNINGLNRQIIVVVVRTENGEFTTRKFVIK